MQYPLADLALSRRLERTEGGSSVAWVEARNRVLPGPPREWAEIGGAYAIHDGAASPLTQTFGLGVTGAPTVHDVARIEAFFRDRGAPVFHEVSPLANESTLALLVERGYQPLEYTSVMFRPIAGDVTLDGRIDPSLRVREAGPADATTWAAVSARGWREHGDFTALMDELAQVNATRPDTRSWLAELDGEPIAAAALNVVDGTAYLAGAATVPERRRRGAQLSLLQHRLRAAADAGCDLAMMCARPGSASQRNAERHGFRIAYTRIKWRLPDP